MCKLKKCEFGDASENIRRAGAGELVHNKDSVSLGSGSTRPLCTTDVDIVILDAHNLRDYRRSHDQNLKSLDVKYYTVLLLV